MPVARRVIRETNKGDMARLIARVMQLGTVEEIEQVLLEAFGKGKRQETTWPTT
jgi:hypothetical protein